ncbi:MAG: NAD-dependent protein deacetylase [Halioglobus sp.]|nr:NAD-dependent protein deacetylase [Halioglobus sp.]
MLKIEKAPLPSRDPTQRRSESNPYPSTYVHFMIQLQKDALTLANLVANYPRLVVLTGAGISHESGIPTYRDKQGTWLHANPIQEQAFMSDDITQQRYWARSWFGWPIMRDARPNPAHFVLAELEKRGAIDLIITQNVDRLHQRAGGHNVVDLHGRIDQVRCLDCNVLHCRDSIQRLLQTQNPWLDAVPSGHLSRPDGDMEVPEHISRALSLPKCHTCGGDLMPNVVFFGGSVPASTVTTCLDALDKADALIAVGSSLMVFSGYRFCRRASQLGKPVVIINPGVTRADDLAQVKLQSPAGPLLTQTLKHFDQG